MRRATGHLRPADAASIMRSVGTCRGSIEEMPGEGGEMVSDGGSQTVLEGLHFKPQWMSLMGCIIGCAEFLGSESTPAWIYGGCGHAFALNIHPAICPSGPTAWPEDIVMALAANVGLGIEGIFCHKSAEDYVALRQEAWDRIRAAVDAGQPCFGWELDVPEWYVILGYDGEGNLIYDKFGQTASVPYTHLGDTGIGLLMVQFVTLGQPADDRTVLRQALDFCLAVGAGEHAREPYRGGLRGYDAWIAALQDEDLIARDEVISMGQAYNAACWNECRQQAIAFLREARQRLGEGDWVTHLDEAIGHYALVAERLAGVAQAFPFTPGDGPAMGARLAETARRAEAVRALTAACVAEQRGLAALERVRGEL